jgi:hypothetical protein
MSLTTIVLFAVAYVVVVAFVLSLLVCAKRADRAAQREHEALVRSMTGRGPLTVVRHDDRLGDIAARRRAG